MNNIYFISIICILFILCINYNSIIKSDNVIVIGSGLAGLSAALTILESGGNVILIEKASNLGGNSSKASSGINAVLTDHQKKKKIVDSIELFFKDTMKSSCHNEDPYKTLVTQLVNKSESAVTWLEKRGVNLNQVAILGGHSNPRTHRPDTNILVGIEIISKLIKHLDKYPNQLQILKNTTVIQLLKKNNIVNGVLYEQNNNRKKLFSKAIILATGGYGNDHSKMSLLHKYRPDLKDFPTTNSPSTTGDGVKMGMLIGALTLDLKEIQVHPTGFIDLKDKTNKTKTLCGEVMRGVGGILLNESGTRFCNELGTRQYVVDKMKEQDTNRFIILLNQLSADQVTSHLNHYISNNLFYKVQNLKELAAKLSIPIKSLESTFNTYNKAAKNKKDSFGKTVFPVEFSKNDVFYFGYVTPVLHYCMGGLQINEKCEVLTETGIIQNLYAAGEVTSGIHGCNRLGGNSLLECNVYGRIAANEVLKKISVSAVSSRINQIIGKLPALPKLNLSKSEIKISIEELKKHNKENDAWMAIDGIVYDVTTYINKHPGGKDAIIRHAGKDVTDLFYQIHEKYMLDDIKSNIVGNLIMENK